MKNHIIKSPQTRSRYGDSKSAASTSMVMGQSADGVGKTAPSKWTVADFVPTVEGKGTRNATMGTISTSKLLIRCPRCLDQKMKMY